MKISAKKRLKPGAVSTIFLKSIHGGSSGLSALSQRSTSETRQHKSVSKLMHYAATHSYNKNNSYIAHDISSYTHSQYMYNGNSYLRTSTSTDV